MKIFKKIKKIWTSFWIKKYKKDNLIPKNYLLGWGLGLGPISNPQKMNYMKKIIKIRIIISFIWFKKTIKIK